MTNACAGHSTSSGASGSSVLSFVIVSFLYGHRSYRQPPFPPLATLVGGLAILAVGAPLWPWLLGRLVIGMGPNLTISPAPGADHLTASLADAPWAVCGGLADRSISTQLIDARRGSREWEEAARAAFSKTREMVAATVAEQPDFCRLAERVEENDALGAMMAFVRFFRMALAIFSAERPTFGSTLLPAPPDD